MKQNISQKRQFVRQLTIHDNLFAVPPTMLSAWVFQDTVALPYSTSLFYTRGTLRTPTSHKTYYYRVLHTTLIVTKSTLSSVVSGQGLPADVTAKSPQ